MAPFGSAACSHDIVAAALDEVVGDVPMLVIVREESHPESVGPAGSVAQLSERLAIAVTMGSEAAAIVVQAARKMVLRSLIVYEVGCDDKEGLAG